MNQENATHNHSSTLPCEQLKLSQQLCFPIYAASRLITQLYRPYLEALGLTYPQYLVMMLLWENGTQSVKEIGDQLFLDSGTLTPMLKRMETDGLISRKRAAHDGRVVLIALTSEGITLKEQAAKIPQAMSCDLDMDPDFLAELKKGMDVFLEKLSRLTI